MDVNCGISAELWNSLGRDKQLAIRDGLRFMGHRSWDIYLPGERIPYDHTIILDELGDLFAAYNPIIDDLSLNFLTLEDVDRFIELTCGNYTWIQMIISRTDIGNNLVKNSKSISLLT